MRATYIVIAVNHHSKVFPMYFIASLIGCRTLVKEKTGSIISDFTHISNECHTNESGGNCILYVV